MKYLKKYKLFESLVDKKIQLLKDLALELQDAGLQVEVVNGSKITDMSYYDNKNFIVMKVTDDNNRYNADLYFTDTIQDFIETLKSYGMNPRSMSFNPILFKFDKHGRMTNSPIIRESNSNKEVLNNIEEIFHEIQDIGFRVEYNRGGVDELLKIYIEKFKTYGHGDESIDVKYYPSEEFVNALLHLISYVEESNLDYRIEILDDSQVVDVISTESEIENMINWEYPIDYIKVIISNKEDN
jgi:hypothetical protein